MTPATRGETHHSRSFEFGCHGPRLGQVRAVISMPGHSTKNWITETALVPRTCPCFEGLVRAGMNTADRGIHQCFGSCRLARMSPQKLRTHPWHQTMKAEEGTDPPKPRSVKPNRHSAKAFLSFPGSCLGTPFWRLCLRTGTASYSGLDPGSSPRCRCPIIIMSTMGQSLERSRSMRRFLVSRPPPNPIREPLLPIHRWQGTMMGRGFFPLAPPTALTALGLPIALARVL